MGIERIIEGMNQLSLNISKSGQDVEFVELIAFRGYRLKTYIRSNAYKSQCIAVISVWSDVALQWNRVASVPFGNMSTPNGMSYDKHWDNADIFAPDCDKLEAQAALILKEGRAA